MIIQKEYSDGMYSVLLSEEEFKLFSSNRILNALRKTNRNIDILGQNIAAKTKVALGRNLNPENVHTIARQATLDSRKNANINSTRDLYRKWASQGKGAKRGSMYYFPE